MIQKIGSTIPIRNITQWPFRRVSMPRKMNRTTGDEGVVGQARGCGDLRPPDDDGGDRLLEPVNHLRRVGESRHLRGLPLAP